MPTSKIGDELEDIELELEATSAETADVTVIQYPPLESFADPLIFPPVALAIAECGWKEPTKVQQISLPHTLRGRDLAGFAQTGTGKTGVFLITVAQRIATARSESRSDSQLAVVLAPTRELAMQIEDDAKKLFSTLNIVSVAVFGGVDYEKQAGLLNSGASVVVATPGRLKDFTQKGVFKPQNVEIFICDEADRMFDMGFIDDVRYFLGKLPEKCQKLLLSATSSPAVAELAFEYLDNPEYVSATPESIAPEKIEQIAYTCESKDKLKVMIGLLRKDNPVCAIVFCNTKMTAEWLCFKLIGNGITSDLITGDLAQNKRINLIAKIKRNELKVLIATDVASRGLHINGLTHVYNFDLPGEAANYVHRIGRTARAGEKGIAISLVCEDYGYNLAAINELLKPNPIRAIWYDADFDSIQDIAENPYKDVNFRNSNRRDQSPRDNRSRSKDFSKRRGERNQGRGNNQTQNNHPQSKKYDRGPRPQRPQRPERMQEKHSPRSYSANTPVSQPPVAAQRPMTVWQTFKSIFSVFFKKP